MSNLTEYERFTTEDGFFTLISPDTAEAYHNRCGAWRETQVIYIDPIQFNKRLARQDTVRLLDPFFGLGYISIGAILTFLETVSTHGFQGKRLDIIAIENDPALIPVFMAVLEQFIAQYDHRCLHELKDAFAHKIYYRTQNDPIQKGARIRLELDTSPISIEFIYDDVRACLPQLTEGSLDAIFHDAFSPTKQPELWTPELFQQYYRLLDKPHGVVHTYSQASHVRAALRQAGFQLYKSALVVTDGYPKPGTLGALEERPEQPDLDDFEVAIMDTRAGIPFRDNASLSKSREDIEAARIEEQADYNGPSTSSIHRRYKKTVTHKTFK
jgi:tRNA U34 5-methylaminomethyl-2-thiouridine-forming methyltransferase MnmC